MSAWFLVQLIALTEVVDGANPKSQNDIPYLDWISMISIE
jgi:hypothetical protein